MAANPSPASARARSPSRSPRSLSRSASFPAAWKSPASARARRASAAPSRSPRALSSTVSQPGSVPVAGVGAGVELVQVPPGGEQLGQAAGGGLVAGVGQHAQDVRGSVQVPALLEQPGQPPWACRRRRRGPAARPGPRARPAAWPATIRRPCRRRRRGPAARLGPRAGSADWPAAWRRPVAGVGGVPVQRDGVAVQQPVTGAVGKPRRVG